PASRTGKDFWTVVVEVRQQDAKEEPVDPHVGRVIVRPANMLKEPSRDGNQHPARKATGHDRQSQPGQTGNRARWRTRQPREKHEHDRQNEVEVLLDCQAPGVSGCDLPVVLDVEEVWQDQSHRAAEPIPFNEQKAEYEGNEHEIAGPDLESPANVESP